MEPLAFVPNGKHSHYFYEPRSGLSNLVIYHHTICGLPLSGILLSASTIISKHPSLADCKLCDYFVLYPFSPIVIFVI